jgi:hypothetical protein
VEEHAAVVVIAIRHMVKKMKIHIFVCIDPDPIGDQNDQKETVL